MARLYDAFAARHGRVSKRQFEFKLNQIAQRSKTDGRTVWMLRPEYAHLQTKHPKTDLMEIN